MKILFLDVDGVLNTENSRKRDGMLTMSRDCIDQLLRIIKETNCQIVLSSSWRIKGYEKDSYFGQALQITCNDEEFEGIMSRIIDGTPIKFSYVPRGYEIQSWIFDWFHDKGNDFTFVIVDDSESVKPFDERFVQTFDEDGLTVDKADRIIEMMKDPPMSWKDIKALIEKSR